MNHLVYAVQAALESNNHYAALATSLTLPDICGWALDPDSGSKVRYIAWFDRYMASNYVCLVGAERQRVVFLNGNDFYALRCAFLHEGRDDITEQRAKQLLSNFRFVVPPPGWTIHRNLHENHGNKTLQLQVDAFCREILHGVTVFQADISDNAIVQSRIASLGRIHDANGGVL